MKTRNTLLAILVIIANLSTIGKAYANDKVNDANIALESINNKIENFVKFQIPKVETVDETCIEINVEEVESVNRVTLEDLTAVPWMIKEVIVKSKKKNISYKNENIVIASIAK
jgi:hypothetical protein